MAADPSTTDSSGAPPQTPGSPTQDPSAAPPQSPGSPTHDPSGAPPQTPGSLTRDPSGAPPQTPGSLTHARRGIFRTFWEWLPTRVDRRVIAAAWATLAVQVAIVGTGGLVRLTGSGLGCPTWPRCTAESLVPTPEMGIHGVIEFGNRLLTFVLVIVAITMFLFVVRMRRERRDLFWLSLVIGLYVPLQAIIGGITVLTNLNPYIVGLHYFASVVLVALAAVLVARVYARPGPRVRAVPAWYAATVHVTSALVLITVVVGILVTGSGPHAGDGGAARNGLDPEFMQHVHSWPAYALFAATLVLVIGAWRTPAVLRLRLWTGLLLAVELAQIVVGLWQARTGLPILLVNIHMVLAVLLVAAMTAVVMHLKSEAPGAASDSAYAGTVEAASPRR